MTSDRGLRSCAAQIGGLAPCCCPCPCCRHLCWSLRPADGSLRRRLRQARRPPVRRLFSLVRDASSYLLNPLAPAKPCIAAPPRLLAGWPLPLLQTAPYGWPLPPPDAFGVGVPCSFSPAVACAPPPAPWGGCGSERPSCPGCPPLCAAPAAPRDYLQEMAALAAAAAAVGLPIPAPPPPLTLPPQMAFMPVAEAGGRGSREGDADVAHMEGEDSDCEGSTDGSEEGKAAGARAPCLPHSRSAVAAAAKAAVEEAAAAAALAARSLAGSQGQRGLGGSGGTLPHTLHAADQLPGEALHKVLGGLSSGGGSSANMVAVC